MADPCSKGIRCAASLYTLIRGKEKKKNFSPIVVGTYDAQTKYSARNPAANSIKEFLRDLSVRENPPRENLFRCFPPLGRRKKKKTHAQEGRKKTNAEFLNLYPPETES